MAGSDQHSDEPEQDDIQETNWEQMLSDERPSGWRALTKFDSVSKILDTLLSRPGREYNKTELASGAGISPQSVHRHLDFLIGIGVVEQVEETRPQRYRLNQSSELTRTIVQLDAQVKSAMTGSSDEEPIKSKKPDKPETVNMDIGEEQKRITAQ